MSPIIDAKVDSLLLGCTHYPFLARTIAEAVGRHVVLVSSADEVAFQVRAILEAEGSGREGPPVPARFFSSGDVDEFARIGSMLLGADVGRVEPWKPGATQ